jgi:endonuclease/exonuclease/phosphatase family metal-dependent hydrolase
MSRMSTTTRHWSRRSFLIAAGAGLSAGVSRFHVAIANPIATQSDGAALKILTCNIRLPLPEDESTGNGWIARREFCAEVMVKQKPDLICLQECREVQLAFLLGKLSGWQAVGLRHPDIGFDRANPILFPKSRFELTTSGGFWLSETPHIEGSKSWDSARGRFCNWAQLADRTAGGEFRLWNTHLDHLGDTARERQASLIADASRAVPTSLPQLLAGDFNAGAEHPAIKAMKDGGWIDTYAAVHGEVDPGFTAHRFLGPAYAKQAKRSRKIDWIFCRAGAKTQAAEIIRDQRDGRFPSDHYFVSATVLLPLPPGEGRGEGKAR